MSWKTIHHGELDDAPVKVTTVYVPASADSVYTTEGEGTHASTTSVSSTQDASLKDNIAVITAYLSKQLVKQLEGEPLPNVFQTLAEYGVVWREALPILHMFTSKRLSYIKDLKELGETVRFEPETINVEVLLDHFNKALSTALWRTQ